MGDIQLWTLILRMAGIVVSIVGLIFVIIQLRRINDTIRGNAFASSFVELRELHKVFIEYPDLRPFFYNNVPIDKDHKGYQRARSIAEMFMDAFIHMYLLRPRLNMKEQKLLDDYVRHMCQSSSFLKDYLMEVADLLHSTELKLIIKRCSTARSDS